MAPLLFILAALALLGLFMGLTQFETRRGVRFFAQARTALDTEVERLTYLLTHIDWEELIRRELGHLLVRLGHAIARLALRMVREVERLLSRAVRELRSRAITEPSATPSGEPTRDFVKTMSDFKRELSSTRPPDSEVH